MGHDVRRGRVAGPCVSRGSASARVRPCVRMAVSRGCHGRSRGLSRLGVAMCVRARVCRGRSGQPAAARMRPGEAGVRAGRVRSLTPPAPWPACSSRGQMMAGHVTLAAAACRGWAVCVRARLCGALASVAGGRMARIGEDRGRGARGRRPGIRRLASRHGAEAAPGTGQSAGGGRERGQRGQRGRAMRRAPARRGQAAVRVGRRGTPRHGARGPTRPRARSRRGPGAVPD